MIPLLFHFHDGIAQVCLRDSPMPITVNRLINVATDKLRLYYKLIVYISDKDDSCFSDLSCLLDWQ